MWADPGKMTGQGGSQLSLATVFCFLQTRAAGAGVSCDGSTGNKSALRHNRESLRGYAGGLNSIESHSQLVNHCLIMTHAAPPTFNFCKNDVIEFRKTLIGRSIEESWLDSSSGYWFLCMDGDLVGVMWRLLIQHNTTKSRQKCGNND